MTTGWSHNNAINPDVQKRRFAAFARRLWRTLAVPKMTIRYIANLVLVFCSLAYAPASLAQKAAPKIELLSVPCSGKTSAKIAVFFSGVTQLNGKTVSLQELSNALKDKTKVTEVCYHRERPDSEAAPTQTEQVLNVIIQERLPVAFYRDAQFLKRVSFKE